MLVAINDRVRNLKIPDWGIGRVLDVTHDGKVRIFFINGGEKLLVLKHVSLEKIEGADAAHPILDNPTFAARATGKEHKGLPDARADFLSLFPDGFEDHQYLRQERNYKVDAHRLLLELLGKEAFIALLAAEDFKEIVKRVLQVVNKTNLIFPNEKMALKDGLIKDPANVPLFANALFELLYGSGLMKNRFEGFAGALAHCDAAKWTTATYFLFLAFPAEHMFLKPTVTQHAAELVKAELNYRSELNWLTYSCLLEFAGYLKTELAKMGMGPRDMIDVQSFMWCIAPGK
jgi:hypothetical protein